MCEQQNTAPVETLDIIYQDEYLIAVHKPAGLLVHRSMIDKHETRFAMQIVRDQIGQHVYPVHRLDKPTSGVLLFALDRSMARQVSDAFAARDTEKTYLAVVRGHTDEADTIDYALKEENDAITDRQAQADKPAQEAVTHYQRLATSELPYPVGRYATARYSLLRLQPHTGRKHQLRRHMKHIFHPIVGDTTHGDGKHNTFFRDHFDCHRLLLTATDLVLPHPVSGLPLHLRTRPDAEFLRMTRALGWQDLP